MARAFESFEDAGGDSFLSQRHADRQRLRPLSRRAGEFAALGDNSGSAGASGGEGIKSFSRKRATAVWGKEFLANVQDV